MRLVPFTVLFTTLVLFTARLAHADYTIDAGTAKGNVTIESVADAQKLRGVSRVVGNLIIQNYDGSDLAALSSLTMIEGSLLVQTNATLASLGGLGALERVYGIVWIGSNPKLGDLGGLARLKSVEQAFTITDNAALTKLLPAGITVGEPIKKIRGSMTIRGNKSLSAAVVDEFVKKCTVGGRVEVRTP